MKYTQETKSHRLESQHTGSKSKNLASTYESKIFGFGELDSESESKILDLES